MRSPLPLKSTNVRTDIEEATARVAASAIAGWTAGVLLAVSSGVWAGLDDATRFALAAFVNAYAFALVAVDASLRAFVQRLGAGLAAAALLAYGAVALVFGASGEWFPEALAAVPGALAALILAPAALAATCGAWRLPLSSAPGRSPVARPDAP